MRTYESFMSTSLLYNIHFDLNANVSILVGEIFQTKLPVTSTFPFVRKKKLENTLMLVNFCYTGAIFNFNKFLRSSAILLIPRKLLRYRRVCCFSFFETTSLHKVVSILNQAFCGYFQLIIEMQKYYIRRY